MPRKKVKRHANAHGEGSTFYDPKREKWTSQLPAALAGKRILKRFDLEADALDWRLRELERLRSGRVGNDPSIPFGRYLRAWLDVHKTHLAPRTALTYDRAIRTIGPLAAVPLRDLTHRDFAALWAAWLTDGLGAQSIVLYRRVLAIALNAAVPDLLPANPIRRAKAPPVPEQRIERWELADANRFLAASDRTPLAAYFRLALGIGARPGELRALQRQDINRTERTVTIERSLSHTRRQVRTTKTRRSRTIDLPAPCYAALVSLLESRRDSSPWLFCHPPGEPLAGEPFGGNYIADQFAAICASVDPAVPRIVLYALRHTAITLMLAAGVPAADVAYIVGHASPATTLKHYSRWMPSGRKRAADIMAELQPALAPQEHGNGHLQPDLQPVGPIREQNEPERT